QLGALLEHEALRLLDAELLHDELEAGARAVGALAQLREHAAAGLRDGEELLLGQELVEDESVLRHGADPPAHGPLEAARRLAVDDARARDGAEVVEVRDAAGVVLATREGDLELAAEVLRVVVAEQEERQRVRVRRDVERLGVADARVRALRDVADRVA